MAVRDWDYSGRSKMAGRLGGENEGRAEPVFRVRTNRELSDTSILLLDDNHMTREGIVSILEKSLNLRVVALSEAAEKDLPRLHFDLYGIVLVDSEFGGDGIRVSQQLLAQSPGAKIILLIEADKEGPILRAFAAGCRGVILKDSQPETLCSAAKAAASGQMYLDSRITEKVVLAALKGRLANRPAGMTFQETRVLRLLPHGLTNKEIATELEISVETVKSHLLRLRRKLGARNRAEAVSIATQKGLIQRSPRKR